MFKAFVSKLKFSSFSLVVCHVKLNQMFLTDQRKFLLISVCNSSVKALLISLDKRTNN